MSSEDCCSYEEEIMIIIEHFLCHEVFNPDCRYDEEMEKKKADFQFGCVIIFAIILFYAIEIN
jgi:hypothetical protein